ncbi:thioredoxin family protein, partial [Salmonella enterica subsp. enterica serovar Infantis]
SPSATASAQVIFTAISTLDELIQALAQAKGKRVMLDFYAVWCVACIEFEKYSFCDPRVEQALGDRVLLLAIVTAIYA